MVIYYDVMYKCWGNYGLQLHERSQLLAMIKHKEEPDFTTQTQHKVLKLRHSLKDKVKTN